MKLHLQFYALVLFVVCVFFSCKKQEYLKSESGIKKDLKGTWDLQAIPKYDSDGQGNQVAHVETWTFSDSQVSIDVQSQSQSGTSYYTVHTSFSKAEFNVESVPAPLAPTHYNGKWQIVTLDDRLLIIANDHDGSTGLTELEFIKRN